LHAHVNRTTHPCTALPSCPTLATTFYGSFVCWSTWYVAATNSK
jgi:hypothetical protein